MSLRAMDIRCCPTHGESLHHYGQCTSCGVQVPTQVEDNTTRAARARQHRRTDRERMRKARAAKASAKRAQGVAL